MDNGEFSLGRITPIKDSQRATAEGETIVSLPQGMKIHRSSTHLDERGSLCEIHNHLWEFLDDPIVHVYKVTIRPGKIKGWTKHATYQDRAMLIEGDLRVVLYDDRSDSPTHKQVSELFFSGNNPTLFNIPSHVYHAFQNIGTKDLTFINMPTKPYCYKHPDKYRLPLENDLIPYKFLDSPGW